MRIQNKSIPTKKIPNKIKKNTTQKIEEFANLLQKDNIKTPIATIDGMNVNSLNLEQCSTQNQKEHITLQKGMQILQIVKKLHRQMLIGSTSINTFQKIIDVLQQNFKHDLFCNNDIGESLKALETRAYVEIHKLKKLKSINNIELK